jgi:hypothetical protein
MAILAACQPEAPPPSEEAAPPGPAPGTPEWKIQNAMSAAPSSISAAATIMDWPASPGAAPAQLRAGTNGWACFPDVPETPGNDPMCLDAVWQAWADAWVNRKPFRTTTAGIGYMLQGGAGTSDTDPFKMQPDSGESWLIDPPHIMWISPDPKALDAMPGDRASGGPFVMWKGTPYVHLMIPVK